MDVIQVLDWFAWGFFMSIGWVLGSWLTNMALSRVRATPPQ
jgi:hypothetical protein